MATAKSTTETISLRDALVDFKETKNIDRATMMSVLEGLRIFIRIF